VIRETHRGALIIVGRRVVVNKSLDGDSSREQAGQGGFRGWVNDANSAWSAREFGGTSPGNWSSDGGRGRPVTIEGVRPDRSEAELEVVESVRAGIGGRLSMLGNIGGTSCSRAKGKQGK
jgi:hypothetical protein